MTKSMLLLRRVGAFTLIELLVTIGILAVVAAAVIAAIDPLDKMKQGRDAKVQSDISGFATALNTYAASNGYFPGSAATATCASDGCTWAELTNTTTSPLLSEMSSFPAASSGYTYGGSTDSNGTTAIVYGTLLSKKYTATAAGQPSKCTVAGALQAWWVWYKTPSATSGQACVMCTLSTAVAPTTGGTCIYM